MTQMRSWLRDVAGLNGEMLETAASACSANAVTEVEHLAMLSRDGDMAEILPQFMIRKFILKGLATRPKGEGGSATDSSSDLHGPGYRWLPTRSVAPTTDTVALPFGKKSHKKEHTRYANEAESFAIRVKDILEERFKLKCFFDLDDLTQINQAAIKDGILASCCLLCFLNDETHQSCWCQFEWGAARDHHIPILVVINSERFMVRDLIKSYIQLGFDHLFSAQVISYSSSHRRACYDQIGKAIIEAVNKPPPVTATDTDTSSNSQQKHVDPHVTSKQTVHAKNMNADAVDASLRLLIGRKFSGTEEFFEAVKDGSGEISKRGWKAAMKMIGFNLTDAARKDLRKRISGSAKTISLQNLLDFTRTGPNESTTSQASQLAAIPPEVPVLPDCWKPRVAAQQRLMEALLEADGASTSVTAPKAKISSQGMGGVGKTSLTAAVVRSIPIRSRFATIAWINLSMEPLIKQLQHRLFEQLSDGEEMPSAAKSVEGKTRELQKVAANREILICLDDIWNAAHEKPFFAIDLQTESKILVTTRIRGILHQSNEIQVELLGIQESVALLAAVGQVDDMVPACCVEIAQLCGRLPLCLNIVGEMIRTFGEGWEDEIPTILKKDMKSLTMGEGDDGNTHQSLNLQQRVIQSGLDSLNGAEAESIVLLFKGMAVFAEDQVVPVAILSVLWVSLDPDKHKPLSAMKVRQWVSQLLSRSILLGDTSAGVSMHDIVRDFSMASHAASELRALQRSFVATLLDHRKEEDLGELRHRSGGALRSLMMSSESVVAIYAGTNLRPHFVHAVTMPLSQDKLARHQLSQGGLYDDKISNQMLSGFSVDQVIELAEAFESEEDYMAALNIHYDMSFKLEGVEMHAKERYILSALKVIDRMQQPIAQNARAMQVVLMTRFLKFSVNASEIDKVSQNVVGLYHDKKQYGLLDDGAKFRVGMWSGLILEGVCPGAIGRVHTVQQRTEGAEAFVLNFTLISRKALSKDASNPDFRAARIVHCLMCYEYSYSYLAHKAMSIYTRVLYGEDVAFLKCMLQYPYDFHANYNRDMTNSGYSEGLDHHSQGSLFLVHRADVDGGRVSYQQWGVADAIATECESQFSLAVLSVWPLLEQAAGSLQHVLNLRKIAWANAEEKLAAFPRHTFEFEYEHEGVVYRKLHSSHTGAVVRAIVATDIPHKITRSDAVELIPPVDAAHLQDQSTEFHGGLCPSLRWLICRSAKFTGAPKISKRHAQAGLAFHINSVKQLHIRMWLGSLCGQS